MGRPKGSKNKKNINPETGGTEADNVNPKFPPEQEVTPQKSGGDDATSEPDNEESSPPPEQTENELLLDDIINIDDEIDNTTPPEQEDEEEYNSTEQDDDKPKQKKHITRQTLEEFKKKAEKIVKFIESPEIKNEFSLGWYPIGGNGLLVYQGSRGNQIIILRHKEYDKFYKTSIKKIFIKRFGRYNLDLEEDYNK